uniref:Uncharacterized protein n=1 Tax=Staphylococcus phage 184DA TaxID=3110532 RepID=A0AAU6MXF5_9CAUD
MWKILRYTAPLPCLTPSYVTNRIVTSILLYVTI